MLATRWNGQLYAVMGESAGDGRWQVRLWWKPFVTLIWYGGLLVALGGVLAIIGRVRDDLKSRSVLRRAAERREDMSPEDMGSEDMAYEDMRSEDLRPEESAL